MNMGTAEAIALVSTLSTVTAKAGANVGTSLSSLITNVDFKKGADALKAYNIEVYDSTGKMRDGVEVWREMARVFNGLKVGDDDKNANVLANALSGGKFRINDFKAIMDNWGEFEKILKSIKEKASPELTSELLRTGMQTYDTNVKQMTASLQILGISIGNELLPMLKGMTIGLTEGVEWLNKHRTEVAQAIKYIGLFVEALAIYRIKQLLATTSLANFVGTAGMMASNAPTFVGAMASMGRSMSGFALTIGSALVKMAAFMTMAEIINRMKNGMDQESAEKSFKTSMAGAGSTDAGAGHRTTEEEQGILDAIDERDEYRRTHSILGTADGGITGGVMYLNGDDKYQADALDKKIMDGLQAIEAKKGLDKVNAMVKLAEQNMPEPKQKESYEPVDGQDLGTAKAKKSPAETMAPTDASIAENKVALKRYTKNLFNILDKNKEQFQEAIDQLGVYSTLYGEANVAFIQKRAQLEQDRIDQLGREKKLLETQSTLLQSKIDDEVTKFPELKAVVDPVGASRTSVPTEANVDVDNVKPQVLNAVAELMEEIKTTFGVSPIVTSGYRAGDPGGHGSGDKMDVAWDGMAWNDNVFNAAVAMAEKRGLKVYTIPHGTGPHLDINGSVLEDTATTQLAKINPSMTQDLWKTMSTKDKLQWKIDNKDESQASQVVNQMLGQIDELEKKSNEKSKELNKLKDDRIKQQYGNSLQPSVIHSKVLESINLQADSVSANTFAYNDPTVAKEESLRKYRVLATENYRYLGELERDLRNTQKAYDAEKDVDKKAELKRLLDDTQKNYDKQKLIIDKAHKEQVDAEHDKDMKIRESWYSVVDDVALKGNSLRSIMANLWKGLADDALKAIFGLHKKGEGGIFAQLLDTMGTKNDNGFTGRQGNAQYLNLLGNIDWQGKSAANAVTPKKTVDVSKPNNNWLGGLSSIVKAWPFADGGIVDKPTNAVIGETGDTEAVINLGKLAKGDSRQKGLLAYANAHTGTKVTAGVSQKTMQTAQSITQANLYSKEHYSATLATNDLLVKQNQVLTYIASQGVKGNNGQVQPVVISNQMSQDQLYSMLNKMKSDGYSGI